MRLTETIEKLLDETSEIEKLLEGLKARLAAIYLLLDKALHDANPPICPKCGSALVICSNRETGNRFLGCVTWKKTGCKGSTGLYEWRETAEKILREKEKKVP